MIFLFVVLLAGCSKNDAKSHIEQINNKIEESVNKVELIKIKEKLTEYNMDTSQVDKMIKRLEPIKDEDIEKLKLLFNREFTKGFLFNEHKEKNKE